jgi:hypothetical protein
MAHLGPTMGGGQNIPTAAPHPNPVERHPPEAHSTPSPPPQGRRPAAGVA